MLFIFSDGKMKEIDPRKGRMETVMVEKQLVEEMNDGSQYFSV